MTQPEIEQAVAEIRVWHRQRCYVMEQRKRADLSLGAFVRLALGWSRNLPEDERKAIASRAKAITEGDASDPAYDGLLDIVAASVAAKAPFEAVEKRATKEMERLAKTLPVWESFAKGVRGLGARSLAVIVAEAGDLSAYDSHSKLWKRMGLAVMDGVRQGGLRKAVAAEQWVAHGYSPKRRSHMFVIGDVLVKVGDHYRAVYLERKGYEKAKAEAAGLTVAPSAKIPRVRANEFISDGHIHHRAQRYMEKRLLRDLWRAWRDEGKAHLRVSETATEELPTPQPVNVAA